MVGSRSQLAREGSCIRLHAERPNHVWFDDFVHPRIHDGRAFRTLNVLDEHTRESVAPGSMESKRPVGAAFCCLA